jgi:dTDP-4-amino-4,6-dideoxygalactose transaminase
VNNKEIAFQQPYRSEKIIDYVNESINSKYYSSGYFEKRCLEILSNKFDINNCLITHSATGALELSALYLKSLGLSKKVFIPSYTFSSTANAFLRSGFEIEFLDIEQDNLMVNIEKISNKVKDNIFVPVHYGGYSVDFTDIGLLKGDTIIVEDAAQGLGVKWKNQQLGTIGDFGAISFHHTKNIQAGFGGLFIAKNSTDFDTIYHIYERGTNRQKVLSGVKSKYEWVEIGSSFQIPDILSAILFAQLEDYEIIINKRKKIYDFYKNYFDKNNSTIVSTPKFSEKSSTNYHAFYIIFNDSEDSSEFIKFTKKHNINCYIGYVPLHTSEMGVKLKLDINLPQTEKIASSVVRLPVHTNITDNDLEHIEKTFDMFFNKKI